MRSNHTLASIRRARILTIARGNEDENDPDHLCSDSAFKLACGRLPSGAADPCSQSTVSC